MRDAVQHPDGVLDGRGLLDADPVIVAVEKLPAVSVTESWIGGRLVVTR